MLINAQSYLYEGIRQNMRVTKHNNADQTFWIFYILCVFGFLTQKQIKIDKKNVKTFKANSKQQTNNQFSTHAREMTQITQTINVTKYRKY